MGLDESGRCQNGGIGRAAGAKLALGAGSWCHLGRDVSKVGAGVARMLQVWT